MKENIFDVLIYLFENYADEDIDQLPSSDGIKVELVQAGFGKNEVNQAFVWLQSLVEHSSIKPSLSEAFRIYSKEEQDKLDLECRDFLLYLELNGILTDRTREIVIDRAMAIENQLLSIEEMKWIVLMVLLSQSDDDIAFSRMEDIVYDLAPAVFH